MFPHEHNFFIILSVFGYLTTSEHQMWRVMPLKTPFRFVNRYITIVHVVTTINYNYLLRIYTAYSLTRQYSILDVFTYTSESNCQLNAIAFA
jgi:hypothetical protein